MMEIRKYRYKKTPWIATWDIASKSYTVNDDSCTWYIPKWLIEDSDEWELQKDNEYEIVEISWPTNDDHEKYRKIHSVKRLSDGEIFKLGDSIKMQGINSPAIPVMTIDAIKPDNHAAGGIALYEKGVQLAIAVAEKVQKPVIESTTITIGDTGYIVQQSFADSINKILQEALEKVKQEVK